DTERWRVVVVNPTGRYARNQVAGLIAAGTPLVGGVALGRGGESMDGLPLYDRVADLPEPPNVAVLYTPAEGVRDAIAQCADAGIRTIVAAPGYLPVHDALAAGARARAAGAWLIGPNTLGMYVPGRGLLGSIAPSFCKAGRLAVIARSGTLTLAMARQLTLGGIGQSLVVHIGGDTVAGRNPHEYLAALAHDPASAAVLYCGEIGGGKGKAPGRGGGGAAQPAGGGGVAPPPPPPRNAWARPARSSAAPARAPPRSLPRSPPPDAGWRRDRSRRWRSWPSSGYAIQCRGDVVRRAPRLFADAVGALRQGLHA